MKFFTSAVSIVFGLLLTGCVHSVGLPKVVSFWVEYGPEKVEPTSNRCMIQVIDIDRRETGKMTQSLVKVSVFSNGGNQKLAAIQHRLLLPDTVVQNTVWKKNEVKVELRSRDGKVLYFSKMIGY